MTTTQETSSTSEALEARTRAELRFALSALDAAIPDDDSVPFFDATGLDSLETYALVTDLEQRLGVEVTDDMVGTWATQGDIVRDLVALQETLDA